VRLVRPVGLLLLMLIYGISISQVEKFCKSEDFSLAKNTYPKDSNV